MRPSLLIVLYLVIAMLPLVLAALRVTPPRPFMDELASGAGLLAFAIILIEFILSGRFRSVSGRIGMDVTMRFHQLLARTALALALFHPLLYSSPFDYQRPWDPTRQLTLTNDIGALTTGLLAWVLLPGFVLLSIGRDRLPYSYETWRLMHGLGAMLIAGFILHHTLETGRYSQDPVLAGFWLAMVVVALASLLYVYIVKPAFQLGKEWTVVSVKAVALKTWALTLAPSNHKGLDYQAGQYAWLNIGHSPFSLNENPFSISSAPAGATDVEFIVKELGDFTGTVGGIKIGTKAFIDGPHGNLVVSDRTEPGIALIAGGVGIAPLLGILRQLHREKDKRPTVLLYGNRVEEQIVFRDELETLTREHGTRVVHVLSEPKEAWSGRTGLIDPVMIREIFQSREMKDWLFVLCGPPTMMDIAEEALIEIGVPSHQILSERFKYD